MGRHSSYCIADDTEPDIIWLSESFQPLSLKVTSSDLSDMHHYFKPYDLNNTMPLKPTNIEVPGTTRLLQVA